MFLGKIEGNMGPWTDVAHTKICSPHIDLSNEVWCTSNGGCMPNLHPREVETPICPNETHSFGTSCPTIRFLDV